MKINTLLVDLGNVLYLIDEKKFVNCFRKKGINLNSFYNPEILEYHRNYEKGKISTKQFFDYIIKKLNVNINFEDFKTCWNSLLIGFIKENVEYLSILSHKYEIYIISNINDLHYNEIKEDEYFSKLNAKKIYLSHFEGMRKPDKDFFYYVINENSLIPTKTLFIDDSPANIDTARNLGLKTLLLENPFNFIKKLKGFLTGIK